MLGKILQTFGEAKETELGIAGCSHMGRAFTFFTDLSYLIFNRHLHSGYYLSDTVIKAL